MTSPLPFNTALVQAYRHANQLKRLYRQGWLQHGVPPERCESVAAHTFGVALLALWIAPQYYRADQC